MGSLGVKNSMRSLIAYHWVIFVLIIQISSPALAAYPSGLNSSQFKMFRKSEGAFAGDEFNFEEVPFFKYFTSKNTSISTFK